MRSCWDFHTNSGIEGGAQMSQHNGSWLAKGLQILIIPQYRATLAVMRDKTCALITVKAKASVIDIHCKPYCVLQPAGTLVIRLCCRTQ